jgi:hypothetical protein
MSTETQQKSIPFGDIVKIYFPLAVAVVGAAITWGVFSSKIEYMSSRITSLESQQIRTDVNYNDLKNSITKVQTILEERLPVKLR